MMEYITPKEVKIETLLPIREGDKPKRLIYIDMSDIDTKYHEVYIEKFKLDWKKFEPGVKFMILPFMCNKKS